MSTPSGRPFDPFDLSPYAPKRARERSTLDRPPVESDDNDVSDDNTSDNETAVPPLYVPRAAMRPEAANERPVDLDEGNPAPHRPDASDGQVAEKRDPAETASHPDLMRLESSLLWLQGTGAVGHLPRAVQLPPVS